MNSITLYSTGCPKCNVLEKKLTAAGIEYEVVTDEKVIADVCETVGTDYLPILEVNGEYYDFAAAITWVGERS